MDNPIIKHLTLTAPTPDQLAKRLITFGDALRARSGAMVEVRWNCAARSDGYEASVTYGLPEPSAARCA